MIYMEGMLCTVAPITANPHINLSLYANDFTIWTSGYHIQHTADILTTFINDTVLPWAQQYNMLLNPGKCHSFLFSNYHCNPRPPITISGTMITHGSKEDPSKIHILGVFFDCQLTFHHHLCYIQQQACQHLSQMSRVANGIFGVSQYDLRAMYVAYICSVLEYAAPVWYPSMSTTALNKIQCLQNKAL